GPADTSGDRLPGARRLERRRSVSDRGAHAPVVRARHRAVALRENRRRRTLDDAGQARRARSAPARVPESMTYSRPTSARRFQMTHSRRHAGVALVLALCAVTGALAQNGKRPIHLNDLARLKTVGDPQVSPDGKWVAYTVGAADAEKDKRDTDLWMASWDGAEQLRLTTTPDSNETVPRWSPDNRYLAFLSARGDETQKKAGA